jgi:hypothetical protein
MDAPTSFIFNQSIEPVAPNGTVWQRLAIRHAMENSGNGGNGIN